MTKRLTGFCLLLAAALATGCAAGKAFRNGEAAMRAGNLDQAVVAYRRAVQAAPDNPNFKIALERAMLAASRFHYDRGREFEQADQLEAALGEYRLASEYDPSNRQIAGQVATVERTIRDRAEAARPRPVSQQLRDRARAASTEPALLNFTSILSPIRFNNASLKDVLSFIADSTGINVTYDREVLDRAVTVQLNGVTLEQALNQIMTMNQLSYKVVSDRSIFVFPDTPPKHAQYDEQVIRTFYIQHADATEMTQLLSTVIRLPGIAIQPVLAPNKNSNAITVRATSSVVQILEKIIEQNDKPRAEIVFDIEILEVDRNRTKEYGLNLSDYALGGIFSPEVSPNATTSGTGTTATTGGTSTAPSAVKSPPPFNLNTISRGVTTADFYMAVPTAIVRFLESDTHTKTIAKPQLRGAEGLKMTLNLGTDIPIVTTSYTPIATGGVGVNPLNSFQLKPVGINIDITPRVTLDGDILIDLNIESSTLGPDVNVAGTNYPSFGTRKVGTRLRLRDGESNLLAGLLREDDSTTVQGYPGAVHVPLFKQLFSGNTIKSQQTDIVMLLTPHIVRTQEIKEEDLRPIYIGSQQNLQVGGPPPLIANPSSAEAPAPSSPASPVPGASAPRPPASAPGAPASPPQVPSGTTLIAPPGSTPVPGTVLVPQTPPSPAPSVTPPPPPVEPVPPAPAQQAAADTVPLISPGIGAAQIVITPPGTQFRVGQGPYTVPISITGAARVSTITLTMTFDPAVLRARSVQEGGFMRSGGVNATFVQQVTPGRIDITITRAADTTGASGTGLLAAVVFDAIAAGNATLSASGSATGPGATAMGLQFRPVTVGVQR